MMRIALEVWRQRSPDEAGRFVRYETHEASPDMSLLELLDVINEGLVQKGEEPIAFDSDCREGILRGAAVCQLHMRSFKDGETIHIEPWRSRAFPVIKDLVAACPNGSAALLPLRRSPISLCFLKPA
jgi:succinate dehydrogenase / fumarate reductase iron-sulfur subunit